MEKKSPLGQCNPTPNCPAIADTRSEVGHLEGDLIVGARNRSRSPRSSTG